ARMAGELRVHRCRDAPVDDDKEYLRSDCAQRPQQRGPREGDARECAADADDAENWHPAVGYLVKATHRLDESRVAYASTCAAPDDAKEDVRPEHRRRT